MDFITTVSTDALAHNGSRPSAGTVFITKLDTYFCYTSSVNVSPCCHGMWASPGEVVRLSQHTSGTPHTTCGHDNSNNWVTWMACLIGLNIDTHLLMYHQTYNISHTLVDNKLADQQDVVGASPVGAAPTTSCWSARCSWSITCRRCSNYIFILDITPGFNGLGKDNYKTKRESFKLKFCDLVCITLEFYSNQHTITDCPLGALVLTWINFNPNMDK